jgi:hypothetical protein
VASDADGHGRALRGQRPRGTRRAMEAMFEMKKLEIATLRAAAEGTTMAV